MPWNKFQFGPLFDGMIDDEAPGGGKGPDDKGDEGADGKGKDKGKDKDGADDKDDPAKLRAELEATRRERDEERRNAKYWAEKAAGKGGDNKGKGARAESDDEPDLDDAAANDEYDDPSKLLEGLTKGGIKTLVAALEKRGFVTEKRAAKLASEIADRRVGQAEKKLTSDAAFNREFPELLDEKSEVFKQTSTVYREMVAAEMSPEEQQDPKNKGRLMELLASAARAVKILSKQRGTGNEERQRTREQRQERIDAQGDRGRGGGFDDDSDDLGPDQLKVLKMMKVDPKDPVFLREVRDARNKSRRAS